MAVVPSSWMPDANMSRVHVHWTGGTYKGNAVDKKSYHILIEGDGKLVRGDRSIKANERNSGMTPASHTKGANTGAIGVSLCCMHDAKQSPFAAGRFPMTKVQWDRMIEVGAELVRRYAIPVTPKTVLTHAEVESNLNRPQMNKWDITRLAFDASVSGPKAVGDLMRRQIAVALDGAAPGGATRGGGSAGLPDDLRLPRFRVRGVAPSTLNFRAAPNGEKRGELPEGTIVERFAMFGDWSQVRTPRGHVGWVFSSFLRAV